MDICWEAINIYLVQCGLQLCHLCPNGLGNLDYLFLALGISFVFHVGRSDSFTIHRGCMIDNACFDNNTISRNAVCVHWYKSVLTDYEVAYLNYADRNY